MEQDPRLRSGQTGTLNSESSPLLVAAEDFAPKGEAQKESRLESHFPWIHNGVGIETPFDLAHDLQAVPMFFSH